jgi:hypothetical protein
MSTVSTQPQRRRRSQRGEGAKDVVAFDAQEFVDAPCRRPSGGAGPARDLNRSSSGSHLGAIAAFGLV